ncbi:MAG: hypothetical protein PHN63_01735, partial [Candidatus Omnitrophica bacterium]|nr:hypothetical protein [Candidatus Omnitrophota bacterium]
MKYNIKKNWISTVEMLSKNRSIFGPFVIIGLIECLLLELSYFAARFPLSKVFGPIIKKFFGEAYLHYPMNLELVPKLFYTGQMAAYIFIGAFLTAVAVQMIVNIRTGHPVILKAIVKSTAKRYMTFVAYGLIYIVVMAILEKG